MVSLVGLEPLRRPLFDGREPLFDVVRVAVFGVAKRSVDGSSAVFLALRDSSGIQNCQPSGAGPQDGSGRQSGLGRQFFGFFGQLGGELKMSGMVRNEPSSSDMRWLLEVLFLS